MGGVVAHVILVSAQVPLVLTLDFGTSDLGLTIVREKSNLSFEVLYQCTEWSSERWRQGACQESRVQVMILIEAQAVTCLVLDFTRSFTTRKFQQNHLI